MREFDDATLVAYVDGECDPATATAIAEASARDAELRARIAVFQESAVMVRAAFADLVDEPVPERLIAAARGAPAPAGGATVVPFHRRPAARWIALPLAASLAALVIGAGAGYWAGSGWLRPAADQTASGRGWLDNLAGYYTLYTEIASERQVAQVDIQTDEREGLQAWLSKRLDRDTPVPDLSPFGYSLRGGRIVISEGRPAGQILYESPDDKRSVAIYVGSSTRRDELPTFQQRNDVSVYYWRREGRTYAIIGKTDQTTIREIANRVEEAGGI